MKAMVMEEVGKPMVVKDWPEPKCPADGAIVRVEGSGICRSDWHLWQGDWGWVGFKPRMPAILGHEFAGVVEEVGKDVKTLKPGARVVVPLVPGMRRLRGLPHGPFQSLLRRGAWAAMRATEF